MEPERIDFTGPPICVVGNINRDVKVPSVPDSNTLLHDGETSVLAIAETIGGGGANSACAAAALGAQVRFVGKTGADGLADRLRHALEVQGVRTYLRRDVSCGTGTTVALGYTSGQRHFLSWLPNNQSLSLDDLDLTALDGCAHLLRADVWFSQAMLEGGNYRLMSEARRRGLKISLDINFDPCWSTGAAADSARRKRQVRDLLGLVDLAHGNVRELQEFSNSPNLPQALARLTEWGAKAVVVHLGAQGAGYFSDGEWTVEPPDPARKAIHSTGTGDVLSICMILLDARKELSVRQKLKVANSVVREFMDGERDLIPLLQA